MAYETGVASNPGDLLTKLCTFAAANGWSQYTPTSGRALAKGNVVVGLNGDADSLDTRAATAVDTGLAWNAQTGHSGITHVCNLGAGPYTAYHFYTATEEGKDLLAAAIEITAGVYRHWIACDLIKRGSYTGGTYTDSQSHSGQADEINDPSSSYHRYLCDTAHANAGQSGHFHCDFDGAASPQWCSLLDADNYTAGAYGTGSVRHDGKLASFSGIGYQRWNFRTPLWPMELFANRASSLRSPIGRIPGLRWANIRNHSPGEILSIGGDNWQLWPCVSRTDSWGSNNSSIPSSAHYAYAYKR